MCQSKEGNDELVRMDDQKTEVLMGYRRSMVKRGVATGVRCAASSQEWGGVEMD